MVKKKSNLSFARRNNPLGIFILANFISDQEMNKVKMKKI